MSCSPRLLVAISLVALATVACSGGGGGAHALRVTSTDTACDISRATVDPGKVDLTVTNKGQDVTEVYVYAGGDRPLGEVEHIQPGEKGSFTVDVGGGDYQVTCKPGEKGDGIRSALHVSGPAASTASEDASTADRATYRGRDSFSVLVGAFDDRVEITEDLVVVEGQTVVFELQNSASKPRQLQILGPDGAVLGEVPPTAPNTSATVTVKFTTTGTYKYLDPSAGPEIKGSSGTFDVID